MRKGREQEGGREGEEERRWSVCNAGLPFSLYNVSSYTCWQAATKVQFLQSSTNMELETGPQRTLHRGGEEGVRKEIKDEGSPYDSPVQKLKVILSLISFTLLKRHIAELPL